MYIEKGIPGNVSEGVKSQTWGSALAYILQNSPEGPQAEFNHTDYGDCIGQQPYHPLGKTTLASMDLISG